VKVDLAERIRHTKKKSRPISIIIDKEFLFVRVGVKLYIRVLWSFVASDRHNVLDLCLDLSPYYNNVSSVDGFLDDVGFRVHSKDHSSEDVLGNDACVRPKEDKWCGIPDTSELLVIEDTGVDFLGSPSKGYRVFKWAVRKGRETISPIGNSCGCYCTVGLMEAGGVAGVNSAFAV
jgi:hypothetical protein